MRFVRTLAAAIAMSCPALAAPVSFSVDVPLTQGKAAVDTFLKARGGNVTGGTFSNQGWKTTARSDFMHFSLPAGIDARRGKLTSVFSSPELSGPKGYFESYHLVALRPNNKPFKPIGAGSASLSNLYIAYREDNVVMQQGRGYFNLFDAGCTDWKLCTGERGSNKGWLGGAGPFTIVQDWTNAIDELSFTPGGGSKTLDLSGSAPAGIISAPQWYVTINACGGSTHNSCGLWDGPTKGGPLGVIYSKVTLELTTECGDNACSVGIESTQNCPTDCGSTGSGGASGSGGSAGQAGGGGASGTPGSGSSAGAGAFGGSSGGPGTGAMTGTGGGSAGAIGGGGTNPSEDSGCGCRTPRGKTTPSWLLFTLAAVVAAGARRRSVKVLGWARHALSSLLFLGLLFSTTHAEAAPKKKLRVATLAPKRSAWGKVFRVWKKALAQESKGRLTLDVYYNAVQGNEGAMVSKMRTGQLDGAALASVGLSRIHRDVLVMQLPGVVDSWSALDKVRKAIGPDIEKRFKKKGFLILGWGDIGLVRQMSKGFAVRRPSDIRGKRPAVWRNEPMGPKVYAKIGGVVPVPVSVTEVLPALRSGRVNLVNAPALAAEQLQWASSLDHIASTSSVCAIGGITFRKKALDDLPPELRKAFFDVQKRMSKQNSKRIRKLDRRAYRRLRRKMTVVHLSRSDKEEWRKVLVPVVKQLAGSTFSKDLIKKVLRVTGKG